MVGKKCLNIVTVKQNKSSHFMWFHFNVNVTGFTPDTDLLRAMFTDTLTKIFFSHTQTVHTSHFLSFQVFQIVGLVASSVIVSGVTSASFISTV